MRMVSRVRSVQWPVLLCRRRSSFDTTNFRDFGLESDRVELLDRQAGEQGTPVLQGAKRLAEGMMPFRVTTFRNAWVLYAPVRRQRMSRPDWAGLASGIIATVKMKSIMGASGTANSSQLFARRRDVSKPRRESTFKRPAAISPEGLLPAEKPRKRPSHGSGQLATLRGNSRATNHLVPYVR